MPKVTNFKPSKAPTTRSARKIAKPAKAAPAAKHVKVPAKKVAKKVNDIKKKSADDSDLLEVCLMLDCTASMCSWINRSKETLADILKNIKKDYAGLKVRVAFVGYRDITDRDRFEIFNFSEDLDACTKFIARMSATGGADFPEDVQGGFNKALNLPWTKGSTRQAFHICDAPGHGKDLVEGSGDSYPNGSPDGFKLQN
jgi:hypothetical protein